MPGTSMLILANVKSSSMVAAVAMLIASQQDKTVKTPAQSSWRKKLVSRHTCILHLVEVEE